MKTDGKPGWYIIAGTPDEYAITDQEKNLLEQIKQKAKAVFEANELISKLEQQASRFSEALTTDQRIEKLFSENRLLRLREANDKRIAELELMSESPFFKNVISKYNSASSDTGASADLPTQPSDPVLSPAPSSQNTTSRAFLMKTKGGRMVWVPEDKLDSWLKAQSDNSPEAEERRQRMTDRAMQLLSQLSDRSRQQHISESEDCIACLSPAPDQSKSSQPIQHHSAPFPTTSQARLPFNRDDCKITNRELQAEFTRCKREQPFLQLYIGKKNPYSGCTINNMYDYHEYLREHAYYDLCDKSFAAALSEETSALRKENEALSKELATANKTAATLRDENIKFSSRHSRLVIIFTLLLIVGFIISCIVVSHKQSDSYLEGERNGYDSGYDVGKDEWYDKGYAEGKNDGYDNGFDAGQKSARRNSSSATSDSSSGLYIGNRNSKKYHFSTCSYLPDEANRIYFDSSSDAETSGYVPCSHCDP